jgi:hypothetical protein
MVTNRGSRLVKPLVHIPQQHVGTHLSLSLKWMINVALQFANWKHRSFASESTQAATGAVGVIDFSVERKPINIPPLVSDEPSPLCCPALSVSPCSSSSSEEFFLPSPIQTLESNAFRSLPLPCGTDVSITQQLNASHNFTNKRLFPLPPRLISGSPPPVTNYWFHELQANPALIVPVHDDAFAPSNMKEPHPFSGLPIEMCSNQGQQWDDSLIERSYTGSMNGYADEAISGWYGMCCGDDFTGTMATDNLASVSLPNDFLLSSSYPEVSSSISPDHMRKLYNMWPDFTPGPPNVDVSSNLPLEPPAQSSIYPGLYPNSCPF